MNVNYDLCIHTKIKAIDTLKHHSLITLTIWNHSFLGVQILTCFSPANICSKTTTEKVEKGVDYVHSYQ